MNELIITGYVATEPEINEFKRKRRRNKKTPQYGLAANFRISVKRSFKKKDGKKYDYFSCSAFDKSAEYIEEYIEEGDYIGIHGTLLNDNYENDDGDMVYKDKITVLRIELLRKRNDEEEGYDYEEESEDNDYDDEEYEEDDYENDYEDDEYEEEELEEEEYEKEEKGYRRSVRKPNRNTTTSYKRSSRQKKTAPKKRSEQRKRAKENSERRKRQGKRSAPERKRGDSRKRNLVDEEFERVQESEYNNYGFD